MDINFNQEKNGTSFVELKFEPKEVESQRRKTFNKLRNSVNVDGFRKGKMSFKTFEKMFGKDLIEMNLLDDIVNKNFYDYLEENDIDPISQPKMTSSNFDDEGGLTAKIDFALKPKYESLDIYSFVLDNENLDNIEAFEKETTDSDIDKILFNFYNKEAVDREVQDNDFLDLDIIDTNDSKYLPEKIQVIVGEENPYINAELLKDLIGKKKGKLARLRDGDLFYDVKVNEISEYTVPEITDEFVKETFDFDSVDDFKKYIKDIAYQRKVNQKLYEYGEKLYNDLLESDSVEVSPLYVEQLKEDIGDLVPELPKLNYLYSKENSDDENLARLGKEFLFLLELVPAESITDEEFLRYFLINSGTKIGKGMSKDNENKLYSMLQNINFRKNYMKRQLGLLKLSKELAE